jgi:putative ribosome biogenesis GTPase RsgA
MFEKGEEAARKIYGKDICILLGVSGVGKSTTIHFLAESKMIETKVGKLSHIGPSEVHNP